MTAIRQQFQSCRRISWLLVCMLAAGLICTAAAAQEPAEVDPLVDAGVLDATEFARLEQWLATDQIRHAWYKRASDRLNQQHERIKSEAAKEAEELGGVAGLREAEPPDDSDAEGEAEDGGDDAEAVEQPVTPLTEEAVVPLSEEAQAAAKEAMVPLDLLLQQKRLVAEQIVILERKVELERSKRDSVLEPVIDLPQEINLPGEIGSSNGDTVAEEAVATEEAQADTDSPAAIANPLQAAAEAVASQEQVAPAAETTATKPESFDPYLADARAELSEAQLRLAAANDRAEQISAAITLFELDLGNVKRWIELVQPAIATGGAGQSGGSEASGSEEFLQESLGKHRQWEQFVGSQIDALKIAREEAVAAIHRLEDEAESLRMRVAFLGSPLAPHRIKRWLVSGGPHVLIIIAVSLFVWLLSRFITARIARAVARHRRTGTKEERQERSETLRRMVQGMINLALVIFAAISLLDQFGVDVTVLLGGAAVFGMAVAFGAQNLIKDYFGGLLILMENQYRVGNVIRIGSITGTVEDISLRMTVLRDLEGIAHFIPHGQITTVSNLSHGWSRTVLDIGVAYKENVDRVMEVLDAVTSELGEDPVYSELLLDRAEILGVDAFGDSAVTIKLMIKTRPLKQWEIKRELLRRIKNRFDELGIEIPFPHRTIYHRSEEDNLAIHFAGESKRA